MFNCLSCIYFGLVEGNYTERFGFSLDFQDDEQRIAIVATNTKDCCIGFAGRWIPNLVYTP